MAKTFTNVRSRAATVFVPDARGTTRPYVSKGPISSLTAKEKEARRVQKTANGGSFNTSMATQGAFFSPQLSTDFLELPQSLREKREIYRHFYNTDPIVGQSIDLHTELPLSKVRLGTPKPATFPKGFKDQHDYASYILWFFTEMCDRIKLFQRLVTMVHHYWLDGGVFAFAEDSTVDVPEELGYDTQTLGTKSVLTESGEPKEEPEVGLVEREDREQEELAYYQKHYAGWDRLIILPIDQVKVTTYSFTDKMRIELIPADRDRALIEQAKAGDAFSEEMVKEIPEEVRDHIEQGKLIPLGLDPDEGSFCYYMAGRRGAGEDLGQSILDRCHLPGTLVLAKRDGVVGQIPIENLDPDIDLVLSAAGNWQEFEIGARKVSEPVILISTSKVPEDVGCTVDHKYQVLRKGELVELCAVDIEAGDYIQVPAVTLSEVITKHDLAEYIDGLTTTYVARKSGNVSPMHLTAKEVQADTFSLEYTKVETDPRALGRLDDLNRVLSWAENLDSPVRLMSAQACALFGVTSSTLKDVRYALAELNYSVTVTRGKELIFPPNKTKISATHNLFSTYNLKRWFDLSPDNGYFLGYFLGDGFISQGPTEEQLKIVYSTKEPLSVISAGKLRSTMGPLGYTSPSRPATTEHDLGASMRCLCLNNDALARWVGHNFGHTSEDKRLPEWVFEAPKAFLMGLIRGFVDSDGDVTRKKDGSLSVRLSNTNSQLSDQLLLVCLSLGLPASKTKPTKSRWIRQPNGSLAWAKPLYAVHFTHGPSVKLFFDSGFLAKAKEPDVWKDGRSGSRHVMYKDQLYYRVSRVSSAQHSGLVYSLNVHNDHSFFASWVATRNCLRTLMYREKLRQAQTQIASRAMTPKRIVWGDRISEMDVMDLREQVDMALVDPDYSIVTNYEIHWEEMGARDRLLDLSGEYEVTDKLLYAGLGVTESLLSGEALYSGDRLKLEVINTRYMFLREMVQEYVENNLFKPVARRKGFVEKNPWGGEVVLYPRLSFTRLPLRDSQDTYDALFNLYNKGSIDISIILEMFNIDPDDTRIKLERDLFTVNDALFNEVLRGIYSAAAQTVVDKTDVATRIIKSLQLKEVEPPAEPEEGRF